MRRRARVSRSESTSPARVLLASGERDGDGAALERAGGRNGTHAFDDDSPSRFETALEIDDGRDRSWSLDRGPKVL